MEFNARDFDSRWYNSPNADKMDLLHDLIKQAFERISTIEEKMEENERTITEAIDAITTSQESHKTISEEILEILKLLKIRTRLTKNLAYEIRSDLESTDLTVLNTEEKVDTLDRKALTLRSRYRLLDWA